MFPCHIVFDSSSCLLCNILFKSSSVEGHQLEKNWLRPRPQSTQVYLILTVFSVHKKDIHEYLRIFCVDFVAAIGFLESLYIAYLLICIRNDYKGPLL